jgi:hypothetical protein
MPGTEPEAEPEAEDAYRSQVEGVPSEALTATALAAAGEGDGGADMSAELHCGSSIGGEPLEGCRRSLRRAAAKSDDVNAPTTSAVGSSKAAAATPPPKEKLPEPVWFHRSRVPQIVLSNVPQQKNDFDCGLYMLHFIEKISTQAHPSFETADGLVEHYGPQFFSKSEVDEKRTKLHQCIAILAKNKWNVQLYPDDDVAAWGLPR